MPSLLNGETGGDMGFWVGYRMGSFPIKERFKDGNEAKQRFERIRGELGFALVILEDTDSPELRRFLESAAHLQVAAP
jgi:hypothetical protein